MSVEQSRLYDTRKGCRSVCGGVGIGPRWAIGLSVDCAQPDPYNTKWWITGQPVLDHGKRVSLSVVPSVVHVETTVICLQGARKLKSELQDHA